MKKYVMLFFFTAAAVATVFAAGQAEKNSIVKVSIIYIKPVSMQHSVTCTGKVENTDDGNVYASASSVVKKIYIKNGDKVEAGQKLMELSSISQQSDSQQSESPSISNYKEAQEAYEAYINNNNSNSSTQNSTQNFDTESYETTEILTAPINGTVTSIAAAHEGSYVNPDKPAVVIKSDTGLQARLSVNESQIADIKVGQKAQITGIGFKNSVYHGTVKNIASNATQVTLVSGTETVVDVIVSIDDSGDDIKPGYTAKAKITTSTSPNILVAPYEAVEADDDGKEYVYRLVGKKALKTYVTTGEEFDNGFAIKNGIKINDKIILSPVNITNGEHVVPLSGRR